jgi:hypothetical protein
VLVDSELRMQFPYTVRFENGVVVPVDLVGHRKGDNLVPAKMRRPFSGDEYYAPAVQSATAR